jgi:hypothetical protein
MGEQFDLLAETIRVEGFDCVNEPRVEMAPALVQQSAIRDLVRERVLERVLQIGKQPRLVDELGSLQVVESATKRLIRQLGDRLKQHERHVLANN